RERRSRIPERSRALRSRGGAPKRATTAPPSPPAPVSFAPRAPARRSASTAPSSGGELTPIAASRPWFTFIASPSASSSPPSPPARPRPQRPPSLRHPPPHLAEEPSVPVGPARCPLAERSDRLLGPAPGPDQAKHQQRLAARAHPAHPTCPAPGRPAKEDRRAP